jgi:hypothetical protein
MGSKATPTNFSFWPSFKFYFSLPHTQYAAKTKTIKIRGQLIKKLIFSPVPKSHIQMGSLSAKNASEKFSRLGTFKAFERRCLSWAFKLLQFFKFIGTTCRSYESLSKLGALTVPDYLMLGFCTKILYESYVVIHVRWKPLFFYNIYCYIHCFFYPFFCFWALNHKLC